MNPEVVLRIDALDNTRAAMNSVKQNLDGVKQQAKGFQDRVRDLQPAFRRMAAVGTATFAGVAFGINRSVEAASRARDIENLFNIAFSNTREDMDAFVTDFSNTFGRAETNIRQQAQNIGFAIQMGTELGEETSASMAQEQIKVAEALAFTFDTVADGEQAMNAITNAFNGNAESLRRLVPTIREPNIALKAMEMGLIETKNQLDENTRAQALHALILDGTTGSVRALEEAEGEYSDTKARQAAQMQELNERIGKAFIPIMNALREAIVPIIERISEWVEENEDLARKIGLGVLAVAGLVAVLGTLGMALLPIITAFKLIAPLILGITAPAWGLIALLGTIAATMTYLALNWQEHWDTIKWAAGEAISWLGERLEGAKNMLRGFANFFIGIGEGIGNSWIRMVNGIIDALNRIQVSIPSWVPGLGGKSFGINIPNVPELNIPRLADGGIVTRSTLANIGEAGPEAVIPLDRMGDFGGGDTYNIYVNGTFADDRETARRVGSEIMHQLKHQRRLTSA